MKVWQALFRRKTDEISRYSLDEYVNDLSFSFNGFRYALGGASTGQTNTEDIENSFCSYVAQAYKSNGVIFAIVLARLLLFTEARFCWWTVKPDGETGEAAGIEGLDVLYRPWPNGSTAELLARMEQDVSFSGNFFAVNEGDRLRRLRPDWVTIVLSAPPAEAVESDVVGYWYHPGRSYNSVSGEEPRDGWYLPEQVCHWSPIPDPEAQYRGMSWITPVLREIQADGAATEHKLNFYRNGATLGAVISAKEPLTDKQFGVWKAAIEAGHTGVENAYKNLYLASPTDVSVTTADMRQLDLKITQGAGETRLCADGGVPPIIVGLSEGLASATYSNYATARRKFGDGWGRPMWRSAAEALAPIVTPPVEGLRLGANERGIAFLREDQKDAAEIQQIKASTINALIAAGWTPESSVASVDADDRTLLVHTGLVSVQLQPPGTGTEVPAEDAAAGETPPAGEEVDDPWADLVGTS